MPTKPQPHLPVEQSSETTSADRGAIWVFRALTASAVIVLAGAFAPQIDGPPVETATASQIRSFLEGHVRLLEMHAVLTAFLVPAVVVFAAALAALARRQELDLVAGVVQAAGILAVIPPLLDTAASCMTLVQTVDGTTLDSVDDTVLRSWYAVGNFTHFLGDLWVGPLTMLTATGSLILLATRLLPRWVSYLGAATAAGGAVGLIAYLLDIPGLLNLWFAGLYGWLLWTTATGITASRALLRSRRGQAFGTPPKGRTR